MGYVSMTVDEVVAPRSKGIGHLHGVLVALTQFRRGYFMTLPSMS